MSDLYKKYIYINQIIKSKEELKNQKLKSASTSINASLLLLTLDALFKISQKDVLKFIKEKVKTDNWVNMEERTLKTYWNYEELDIEEIVRIENENIKVNYIHKDNKIDEKEKNSKLEKRGIKSLQANSKPIN